MSDLKPITHTELARIIGVSPRKVKQMWLAGEIEPHHLSDSGRPYFTVAMYRQQQLERAGLAEVARSERMAS